MEDLTLERILMSVRRLAVATAHDSGFRRALAADARSALRSLGLEHPAVPTSLAPGPATSLPELNAATLLGIPAGPGGEPSRNEEQDLVLLSWGARPLLLWHGPEASLVSWAARARARGLTALLSACEFTPETDLRLGGYSNCLSDLRPARPGSGFWRGLLISPSAATTVLGWLALWQGWDVLLGHLLGYPACCVDAFGRRWPTAWAQAAGDLGLLLAAETGGAPRLPWELNIFARYFGVGLVAHFPCRLDCPASLALARRFAQSLSLAMPEAFDAGRELLASVVVAAGEDGVAVLPGARLLHEGGVARLSWTVGAERTTVPGGRLERALRRSNDARFGPEGLVFPGETFAARILDFTAVDAAPRLEVEA
jgi:hypothetical protein